jgi:hypothetical protein
MRRRTRRRRGRRKRRKDKALSSRTRDRSSFEHRAAQPNITRRVDTTLLLTSSAKDTALTYLT